MTDAVSARMKERHLKNIPVANGNNRPTALLTARAILRVGLGVAEDQEAQSIDYVKGRWLPATARSVPAQKE